MHTKPHAVRHDFDVDAVFRTSRCGSLFNYTSGRERAPDIRGDLARAFVPSTSMIAESTETVPFVKSKLTICIFYRFR